MLLTIVLITPPAKFDQAQWTKQLQVFESQWEHQKWGAKGEAPGTVGTPAVAIMNARAKWAHYL